MTTNCRFAVLGLQNLDLCLGVGVGRAFSFLVSTAGESAKGDCPTNDSWKNPTQWCIFRKTQLAHAHTFTLSASHPPQQSLTSAKGDKSSTAGKAGSTGLKLRAEHLGTRTGLLKGTVAKKKVKACTYAETGLGHFFLPHTEH